MLGLGEQVGGDITRIGGSIGKDDHLRRSRDHVDADRSEHAPLSRRDIGIARTDDLVHRRDGLGPVGERRDRLRAADAVDLVTPAMRAAASTSGLTWPSGVGTTIANRRQPATFAGTAFITTEEG